MSEFDFERRSKRTGIWIALGLAAAAIAVVVVVWLRQRGEAPRTLELTPPSAGAPSAPQAASGPVPQVDDLQVRSLLESVSSQALFRRWLGEGDLVRRWVVVTDNLAEGVSPVRQLGFLALRRPFSVSKKAGKTVISPDTYRRYDDFADAVTSVDARALALVYRELHPVLEAAYRALGYPNATFDRVTAKALQRIEAAPLQAGDVFVADEGGTYVFSDLRLEKLGPIDKQLIRMGPRNMRLLQAKARECREALGLEAAEGLGSGR